MHVLFKFNVYIHYILHRLLIEKKIVFAAFITIFYCFARIIFIIQEYLYTGILYLYRYIAFIIRSV